MSDLNEFHYKQLIKDFLNNIEDIVIYEINWSVYIIKSMKNKNYLLINGSELKNDNSGMWVKIRVLDKDVILRKSISRMSKEKLQIKEIIYKYLKMTKILKFDHNGLIFVKEGAKSWDSDIFFKQNKVTSFSRNTSSGNVDSTIDFINLKKNSTVIKDFLFEHKIKNEEMLNLKRSLQLECFPESISNNYLTYSMKYWLYNLIFNK